jgi:ubiquinol-cytochrome c reductase cytochrome b subunit
MFTALLILLALPITDISRLRGAQFKPLSKILFYIFAANFLILMALGAKHVESPFIEFGQISTVLYFSYFVILLPLVSVIENTIVHFSTESKSKSIFSSTLTIILISFFIYIILNIII